MCGTETLPAMALETCSAPGHMTEIAAFLKEFSKTRSLTGLLAGRQQSDILGPDKQKYNYSLEKWEGKLFYSCNSITILGYSS